MSVWSDPEAAEFLRSRGISHSTVERFRLTLAHDRRIAIPYQDGFYRTRAWRLRRLPSHPDWMPKVQGKKGVKSHLFAVRGADADVCVIAEGEMDVMTLWQLGYKAVGIAGATNWKEEWALLFRGCDRVVMALDADDAGKQACRRIERDLGRWGVDVSRAELPDGADINDLYLEGGDRRVWQAVVQ